MNESSATVTAEQKPPSGETSWLRSFLSRYIFHTDRTAHEERLFRVTLRDESIPLLKGVMGTVCVLVLITWPSDFLLFDAPVVYWAVIWRSAAVVFSVGLWVSLSLSRAVQRNINIIFVSLSTVLVAVAGTALGNAAQLTQLDSILTPWLDIAYLIPLLTTLLSLRILPRLFSTGLITVVYILSYLLTFPMTSWMSPYLASALITSGTSVVMCTVLGHAIYHLNRRNFFQERKLEEERQTIEEMANHDQLTGLKNYRSFHRTFEREFDRARRYDTLLTLLMMDLDRFKEVNDEYGHLIGDRVLEETGNIIRNNIRASDIAARYGGEEFTILLPETNLEESTKLAERLRQQLKETAFTSGSERFTVTGSVGVAEFSSGMEEPDDLIRAADGALLEAKNRGRDRLVVAD